MGLNLSLNKSLTFQTRGMTSMDIWMLICMGFVASAQFEYAMQLSIRFGQVNGIRNAGEKQRKAEASEGKCRKIDGFAMRIFLVVYILTVGSYFYNVCSKSSSHWGANFDDSWKKNFENLQNYRVTSCSYIITCIVRNANCSYTHYVIWITSQ